MNIERHKKFSASAFSAFQAGWCKAQRHRWMQFAREDRRNGKHSFAQSLRNAKRYHRDFMRYMLKVCDVDVANGEGAGVPPSVGTRSAATEEQSPISTHPEMDPDAYIATLDEGRAWPTTE